MSTVELKYKIYCAYPKKYCMDTLYNAIQYESGFEITKFSKSLDIMEMYSDEQDKKGVYKVHFSDINNKLTEIKITLKYENDSSPGISMSQLLDNIKKIVDAITKILI